VRRGPKQANPAEGPPGKKKRSIILLISSKEKEEEERANSALPRTAEPVNRKKKFSGKGKQPLPTSAKGRRSDLPEKRV